MEIILCDDNNDFLILLKNKINDICERKNYVVQIQSYNSAKQMINKLEESFLDSPIAFLLDVDMPEMNGFDIAKRVRQLNISTYIIFVSNKDELVFQSLKYRPFFFLRKNYLEEELEDQLNALNDIMNPKHTTITLLNGHNQMTIPIESVCYAECERNYLLLYREKNKEETKIKIRMKISDAEREWKQYGFIRVHKGFLVNLKWVDKLKKERIKMIDGTEVPIGKSYMLKIKSALLEVEYN